MAAAGCASREQAAPGGREAQCPIPDILLDSTRQRQQVAATRQDAAEDRASRRVYSRYLRPAQASKALAQRQYRGETRKYLRNRGIRRRGRGLARVLCRFDDGNKGVGGKAKRRNGRHDKAMFGIGHN